MPLSMSELQTPEMTAWVQAIASSTFHEHIQDIADEQMEKVYDKFREDRLMRLERDFNAHRDRTEERFDRLENAIAELAQAQKRTEERVEELAEAQKRTEKRVEELAEAQKRTEKRVEELAEAQKRTEKRVEELAEAQKRTEKRLDRLENVVAELAEAQKRTEKRVAELAEAQKRTEKRLDRLENVVAELAEAQKRTEKRVERLAQVQEHLVERVDDLDHRMGLVGNLLGLEAEGEAEETMVYILEQKGYQLLDAPYALAVDGIEIDVVAPVEGPDGERVSVLVDVKARARLKELRRWAGRLQDAAFQEQLVEAGVAKPFLPYFFGLRVYQIVDQEANRLGIGVVDPNGERVEPTLLR